MFQFFPELNRRYRLLLGGLILAPALILFSQRSFVPAWNSTGGDFANYYTASKLVDEGVPLEPGYYSFAWFQQQMDRYGIQHQVGGWIPHPPMAALVFLPFVQLEPLAAKRIWLVINLVLGALCVYLLSRISQMAPLDTLVLFLACGYGLGNNFLFGQLYLLVLASILLSVAIWKSGRPVLAGIVLGLMIPVKYVGLPLLLFFCWKRQWKLFWACLATIVLIVLGTVFMTDWATIHTFLTEVLPRHLKGEIQDPYSLALQTWNSLFRRLFLFEPYLSPSPAVVSPFLFIFLKSLAFWLLSAIALLVFLSVRLADEGAQTLFHLGWIPLTVLLLSPASATYHFLLTSMSCVFFARILLSLGRRRAAVSVAILFLFLNLPHYMKLTKLGSGWSTPLAYPRLWCLLLIFFAIIFLFRSGLALPKRHLAAASIFVALTVSCTTAAVYGAERRRPSDGATQVDIEGDSYRKNLGLILESPSRGGNQVLFSYCELFANRYSIFDMEGRLRAAEDFNLYHPALYADDSKLLVETVRNGHPEIWGTPGGSQTLAFLVEGSEPEWHPGGDRFVFQASGHLFSYRMADGVVNPLDAVGGSFSPAFSPNGRALFYCVRESNGDSLRQLDMVTGKESTLLPAHQRLRGPSVSPDSRVVAFSGSFDGNWDIWLLSLPSDKLVRLTSDPAIDRDPVWSRDASNLLFLSDRKRGLGCTTLYRVPVPEQLR